MAFLLVLFIVLMIVGWHFVFIMLGGVLIIGGIGILIAIASIVLFCAAVLAIISFPGAAVVLIVGVIFAIWTLVAVILAPILFPIVLPLLIIFAVLARKHRKAKQLYYKQQLHNENNPPKL